MKRIMLLIATNLAIVLVLGIVSTLTGANRFFTSGGLDFGRLLFFALIMGFGGAFISLWLSKTIAKWSTGARVVESPANSTEFWLLETVGRFAQKAGLPMPEVAIDDIESDLYLAIDRAVDRVGRTLSRRLARQREHRHDRPGVARSAPEAAAEIMVSAPSGA